MRNGDPAEGKLSRAFASGGDSTPRDALFASSGGRYSSGQTWARFRRNHQVLIPDLIVRHSRKLGGIHDGLGPARESPDDRQSPGSSLERSSD